MSKACIFAPNASPAAGPYSHAVRAGNLLFVSGQGPFAKDGSGAQPGTIEEETVRTLENLKAVLTDAGSGLEHVVKTTCFLKDMNNFKVFNSVRIGVIGGISTLPGAPLHAIDLNFGKPDLTQGCGNGGDVGQGFIKLALYPQPGFGVLPRPRRQL